MHEIKRDGKWYLLQGKDTREVFQKPRAPPGCEDVADAYGEAVNDAGRKRKTFGSRLVDKLRIASNGAKQSLYNRHLDREKFHLEVGVGRGGDFWKLSKAVKDNRICGVVGIDGSPTALEEAHRRAKQAGLNVRLFVCDACRFGWAGVLLGQECPMFDTVAIQFALHYFVQNENTLRHFFDQLKLITEPTATVFGVTLRMDASFSKDGVTIETQCRNPGFGQRSCVLIPGLVESSPGVPLNEYVVDWNALEPVLLEMGFYLNGLRPMANDPTDCYVEFELIRFK